MNLRRLALTTVLLAPASQARSAEITDVVDAQDEANDNLFDIHIEPSIGQSHERGIIAREANCDDCSDPQTVYRRELDYRRVTTEMNFDLQIGLHRDLELHVGLPVVISDRTTLSYASGVNEDNSTIDPSAERVGQDVRNGGVFSTYRYLSIPDDGVRRSGFGDMRVGIAWAPFNDARAGHTATLKLGVDYVAPTGTPQRGSNTGVGRGVHELEITIAASRRIREFAEPYFAFTFAQPFAAGNGLFDERSPNSENRAPGFRMDFDAGTEVVLYEDPDSGSHYSWDLGATFGFTFQGRDYTPLSDALSRSACNGRSAGQVGFDGAADQDTNFSPDDDFTPAEAACAWVAQQPSNLVDDGSVNATDWTYAHNGITDVDNYARLGGRTGFNLQFSPYVELRFGVGVEWSSAHAITAANSGIPRDTDTVQLNDEVERNPFYNLTMDSAGRRFRVENALDITWDLAAAFQF